MDEIEIRGKINKEEFEKLRLFLTKNTELVDEYERLTVDISPGFNIEKKVWENPSEIDLRLKKSGENEKISVKIGHYASKNRQEFEIDLKEGEMVDALKLFEALGYKTGMVYNWKSKIYKYKDFEIKINEYPNGYFDWEIESLNPKSDPDELAEELSLHPFTEGEFQKEIDWKNNNLHELYSLEKVKAILKTETWN
jgi:adenylate cyclase class IV